MNKRDAKKPAAGRVMHRPKRKPNLGGRPETGRTCAVCKRTTAPTGQKLTAGFHTILSRNGIAGDKAHPDCVRTLSKS
jgi:hypothetical protein